MMPLRSKPHIRASRRGQLGATMIELLVSIVIFAFGMLGLVGLQTKTLAYGQSGLYRSQATALTDDILDRMRTDRSNAKAGNWNTALTTKSTSISGTLVYQTDLKDWKEQVEALLPGGEARIDVVGGVATVTIQWDEERAGGSATEQFVTVSRL